MHVTRFSIKQPVLINLLTLLILVVGLYAWIKMPREVFPSVDRRHVTITTVYPGVAPAEIEQLITIPLERALATVDDIETIEARSSEGRSVIRAEMKDNVKDPNRVLLDIQTAVARVSDLPTDAEDPIVRGVKRQIPVMWMAISAAIPEKELRALGNDLVGDLEEIEGVSEALVFGIRPVQITIEVEPARLTAKQLTIADVMQAVRRKHANVPGGTLYAERGEYLIRTVGRFSGAPAVRRIVVRGSPMGTVTVGEVAHVYEGFQDAVSSSRVMGNPSAFLVVYKTEEADAIKVNALVREYLVETKNRYPEGAQVKILWDSSKMIMRRQSTMYQNGLVGLCLVVFLLFVFLDWRMALVTALGIPVAFFGAFIIMHLMGLTINMITMFGLIMVVGMLVDDAVIVVENFYRHLMMGKTRLEAAVRGCSEVVWPVVAGGGTTVVAYLVLVRLPGRMGRILAFLPMVVSAALAVSLIEALLILPSHLREFARRPKGVKKVTEEEEERILAEDAARRQKDLGPSIQDPEEARATGHEARWFLAFQNGFRVVLGGVTRFWYVSLPILVFIFISIAVWAWKTTPFIPFPRTTIDRFDVGIELAVGTKLEKTTETVKKIEKKLAGYGPKIIDSYICRVGMHNFRGRQQRIATHLAHCSIRMALDGKGPKSAMQLLKEIRPTLDNLEGVENTQVFFSRHGPQAGEPIQIQVRGNDERVIRKMAGEVIGFARGIRGVFDVHHDLESGKRELRVQVDEDAAARLGLDVTAIGTAVRNAFGGGVAAKLQRGEDEIDVVVRFPQDMRRRRTDIESMLIRAPSGALVPFKAVASLSEAVGPSSLVRVDRKRTVTVFGQVDDKIISDQAANDRIRKFADGLKDRYPGYEVKFAGAQEESRKMGQGIFEAFLLAMLLIYIILATIFRSFIQPVIIILGAIPFAVVGVLVGLKIHGLPITLIGALGAVALLGIVVNDSLVLVDFINKARKSGMGVKQAVVEAGATRLRPVLLTSITTCAGLLPMAAGWFGAEEFLQPMAVTIVWGLIFATVLTLVIVPCVYLLVDTIRRAVLWPVRAIRSFGQRGEDPGPA